MSLYGMGGLKVTFWAKEDHCLGAWDTPGDAGEHFAQDLFRGRIKGGKTEGFR